jgi:hypothetical protein
MPIAVDTSRRAILMIASSLLLLHSFSVDARKHPHRLTQVAPGVLAGALQYKESSSEGTRRSLVAGSQGKTIEQYL